MVMIASLRDLKQKTTNMEVCCGKEKVALNLDFKLGCTRLVQMHVWSRYTDHETLLITMSPAATSETLDAMGNCLCSHRSGHDHE
jgi:hypothetical protein